MTDTSGFQKFLAFLLCDGVDRFPASAEVQGALHSLFGWTPDDTIHAITESQQFGLCRLESGRVVISLSRHAAGYLVDLMDEAERAQYKAQARVVSTCAKLDK